MKDLSPAVGASGRQSGQQSQLPPADLLLARPPACPEWLGKAGRGAVVVLLGLGSPSSEQICHPHAQDHNQTSSIRPGEEAFKLQILSWGE